MKILHVNYHDLRGGAAIAAFRLCRAQRVLGMDSRMLTVEKSSREPWVETVPPSDAVKMRFFQRAEHLLNLAGADRKNFLPHSLNLFPTGTVQAILKLAPDIVHLHWVNGNMLSLREIAQIPLPVVWTLHDTWAYCGSEHYHLLGDDRFIRGYDDRSLEGFVWRRKRKYWKKFSPVVVGPSAWIAGEARSSLLLGNCRIEHIFNGVDFGEFGRRPRGEARRRWGIPPEAKVIVVGAVSLGGRNKGGELLKESLAAFPEAVVLALGGNVPADLHKNTVRAGRIGDAETMALAYSAGDVFLSVARYDNLPNMLVESVACGTPVVAVDAGGVREIVTPENGVVTPSKSDEITAALRGVLYGENRFVPSAAKFDAAKTAAAYGELYRSIL